MTLDRRPCVLTPEGEPAEMGTIGSRAGTNDPVGSMLRANTV